LKRFLTAIALTASALAPLVSWKSAPAGGGVTVDIPRGTSSMEMAAMLADQGVVASRWHFLAARCLRPSVRLQAGEYRFQMPASPWQIVSRLVRGDVVRHVFTVPEGHNVFEIAADLDRAGLIAGFDFLDAVRDPGLIRDLAPEANSLEGYLFPSTYYLTKHTTAAELCKMMTAEFRRVWERLGDGAHVHETVTLASLVEKETSVPNERLLVASVYRNRLELGMRLECDPATIYAALLAGRYKGTIHQSDLSRDHPYNTYRRTGLPPGPIANPGEASLRAALNPGRTSYLFFVAKPDLSGAHTFSVTLAEHSAAVGKYRRGLRRQKETARVARPGKTADR
jgi:UPF0755 protein